MSQILINLQHSKLDLLWWLFGIDKPNMTVLMYGDKDEISCHVLLLCRGWDVVILKQLFVYNKTKVWMFGKIKRKTNTDD